MKKNTQTPEILHRGSLMTYQADGTECCFGYLFDSKEHGIFEPSFGKLDVTPEEAKTHNELLSHAEIEGLDQNCAVGLGGNFYARNREGQTNVTTWVGEVVSNEARIKGSVITFKRKGMTFRGKLRRDNDWFFFKRIE